MSELHRVTVDPDHCGGRPCIRALRIRVKDVLDLLAAGASRDEIVADYPLLEPEDITAALEYAARQSDHPVLPVAWCVFERVLPRLLQALERGETLIEIIWTC